MVLENTRKEEKEGRGIGLLSGKDGNVNGKDGV